MMIRVTKPYSVIITMAAGIVLVNGILRFDPIRIAIGAALGLILHFALMMISIAVIMGRNLKLYKVFDQYGFSREYLQAYEQYCISGKPFNMQHALSYAEIFMNIGKGDEAIKYLNTLTVPETANIGFQAQYFYIYVMSALKIGNLAIAEDMWNKSSTLINRITTNPQDASFGYLIVMPIICIDCYAARNNGDKTRLERAFQQTENFMSTAAYHTYLNHHGGFTFEVIRLYELRELGMTDKYNALLPKVKNRIENSKRLFTCMKTMELDDLAKIENGEFPL